MRQRRHIRSRAHRKRLSRTDPDGHRGRGPGIPEDRLGRVFEPFFRVNHARQQVIAGAGLGSTTARETIRLASGTIAIRNGVGSGLVQTVSFPAVQPAHELLASPESAVCAAWQSHGGLELWHRTAMAVRGKQVAPIDIERDHAGVGPRPKPL